MRGCRPPLPQRRQEGSDGREMKEGRASDHLEGLFKHRWLACTPEDADPGELGRGPSIFIFNLFPDAMAAGDLDAFL